MKIVRQSSCKRRTELAEYATVVNEVVQRATLNAASVNGISIVFHITELDGMATLVTVIGTRPHRNTFR
ncbi:hypothetical protein ABEW34_07635 [Paenibacillus algorifonticola]|uniref:hypothetical protein n=1 Tax=Paenibacillus algorifonticola TaxID=684063 RepID=UPI003D2AB321